MRIGSIGYATPQGLGHLLKWFHGQGVVTDVMLVRHPRHPNHEEWYPNALRVGRSVAAQPGVEDFLRPLDAFLCFETPFDWSLLPLCSRLGVKTVLISMHEWTPIKMPYQFDQIVSPSLLDQQYFPGSEYAPIPVPPGVGWKLRTRAERFLHNAGHVGHREHKGTRQLLAALKHVKSDIRLTVTCQYAGMVQRMAEEEGAANDPRLTMRDGYPPYETIFDDGDVYVAPEKFNGLSLPLMEARAAGLLVMTTDRFPANAWLPKEPLIPVHGYQKARISPQYHEFDEAIVDPRDIAATIDAWHGGDIEAYSESGKAWAEANSWEKLKPRWLEVLA